jgi:ankyrin repeat protein
MVYAAGQGCTPCVEALLAAGVDVNQRYANEATALMWAAAYGHADTVKFLLTRGADPAVTDSRGKTAAAIAAEEKHAVVAALLAGPVAGRNRSE